MNMLILGVALWIAAHFFKRVLPGPRAALQDRVGDASRGLFAAAILLSLVLIIIGYRGAGEEFVYQPPDWGRHLNNLLMLFAVALFGLGHSKSRLRGMMRHPMLTGAILWAVAHLLANGDKASLILFGSLGVWAAAQILLINARAPRPEPYTGGSVAGDIRLAIITLVIFAVIVGIHTWLGFQPLGA